MDAKWWHKDSAPRDSRCAPRGQLSCGHAGAGDTGQSCSTRWPGQDLKCLVLGWDRPTVAGSSACALSWGRVDEGGRRNHLGL